MKARRSSSVSGPRLSASSTPSAKLCPSGTTDNARIHGPDRRKIRGRHRTASGQVLVQLEGAHGRRQPVEPVRHDADVGCMNHARHLRPAHWRLNPNIRVPAQRIQRRRIANWLRRARAIHGRSALPSR